jgi:DNA-binding CsgD family transcriptional regulator
MVDGWDAFALDGDLLVLTVPADETSSVAGAEVLTGAEREVTALLSQGLSNAEIAARRQTSESTVANQVTAIFRKVGASSRAELVLLLEQPASGGEPRGP